MDSGLLLRSVTAIESIQSGLAPVELAMAVPAGEMWLLQEVVTYHDDGAGATLQWQIVGEAAANFYIPIGATATGVRVRFGSYYSTPCWMAPTWQLKIAPSAALGGAARLYMSYHVHKFRGVPAGSYL